MKSNITSYWYVLYTLSKYEIKVNATLQELGIKSFLPTKKVVRQWSDRKKKIEQPLFPNYIFVNPEGRQRNDVFKVKGVVKYLAINGELNKVSDNIIESIRAVLTGNFEVLNGVFNEGDKVSITKGSLNGLSGRLVEKRGKYKVAIQLEAIGQSMIVEVAAQDILITP